MIVHIKGRTYDVSAAASSRILHGRWAGDEAGELIGGPILGAGLPPGTRVDEVLSTTEALMTHAAERTFS